MSPPLPARYSGKGRKDRILLPTVLLLALILRIRGIQLLFPYFEVGPDERYLIEPALRIVQTGNFNPQFFWYGSFPIYWIALVFFLVLGVPCAVTEAPWVHCLRVFELYDRHYLLYYLGRVSSVLFGLGTILLVYVIGRKLMGRKTAFLAALFLSVSPLHIFFSQIFKVDISLVFWVLLAAYYSLRIFEGGALRHYLGVGISAGLALGTKYNFLALAPFVPALLWSVSSRGEKIRRGVLVLALSLIVFLATCPYLLLDLPAVIWAAGYFSFIGRHIYGTVGASSSLPVGIYRFLVIFPFYFGPLVYLMFFVGAGKAVRSDRRRGVIFLIFPVLYFFVSSFFTDTIHPQYQLPLVPFVFLGGAYGMIQLTESRMEMMRLLGWAVIVLSFLFFGSDLKYPHFKGVYGPYREAGEWVDREIPKRDPVLYYWWAYPPTEQLQFPVQHYAHGASKLSVGTVRAFQPEWIVVVDSHVLRDQRYRALRSYRELLADLEAGRMGSYQVASEFRPDPLWERVAGAIHREYSDFRIRVYRRQ